MNCLLLIFFFRLFNLCGFFFAILCFCFLFVCLFFFVIPCLVFCWFWGTGLTVSFALLFIVICLFFFLIYFIYLFFFFTFMDFLGLFFVSLTALGTSSLRLIVFPLGGCTWAPFRGLVSRGSKLYKWWFGKASGLIDIELMNMVPRKRLTMGWEDDTWTRGGVRLLLPPGWSWLDDLGDGVNCLFFSYLLKIHGDWWLAISYSELSVTLRDLFCLLQGAVKAPRLGGEFHSAFWNIIPVTTPIKLRRLLMLPRRKERGETSPKILLNCWVGVVKIPLCSDGLENGVKCSKIE